MYIKFAKSIRWKQLSGKYLLLSGGTMTGDINTNSYLKFTNHDGVGWTYGPIITANSDGTLTLNTLQKCLFLLHLFHSYNNKQYWYWNWMYCYNSITNFYIC